MRETATGEAPSARPRSAGPDQLKALLLVLVVFGHTYMVPLDSDLLRYMIYGFHMPAFLFLSGYLVSEASLRRRSLGELLRHYWRRMLLAWLVVSLVWRAAATPGASWAPKDLVDAVVLQPAFHLWYIPALMLAVVVAWVLVRTARPGLWIGAVAALAYLGTPALESITGPLPFDRRYLLYFVYFAFGLMVRNGWARVLPVPWALASVAGGLVLRAAVFAGAESIDQLAWLVLNIGAMSLVPPAIGWLERPLPAIGPSLATIGQYSLWVYLLHPFVTSGKVMPGAEIWGSSVPLSLAVTVLVLVVAVVLIAVGTRLRERIGGRPVGGAAF
ncbi:acyltransferase family protein [Demequina iriomotensis]|uniref:acyltransferase family protein n=1 Tax=Demequina iriomotensis TaxID=1536641 RepID=UPI0007807593|nr:acyltransferase [Demequina iriomotensis]